jgi:hypothetical protein
METYICFIFYALIIRFYNTICKMYLVLVVDDEGSLSLDASSVPHLTNSGPVPLGLVHLRITKINFNTN